jgi:hypothetical protein
VRGSATLFQLDRGPGVIPGGDLEIGYVPDFLSQRIRIAFVWGMAGMSYSLSGRDDRLFTIKGNPNPDYSGSIELHAACLSLELAARLLSLEARASPYVVWRPRLLLIKTVSDLSLGGVDLGEVQEWRWYPTAEAGLGVEIRIGPGLLFAELSAGLFPLTNRTVGNAVSLSLVAAIGYRHVFERR